MRHIALLACLLQVNPIIAQIGPPNLEVISSDEALKRALENNVLTFENPPFHAILEIKPEKEEDPAFIGRIELFWSSERQYKLSVDSRDFAQTLVVNGEQVQETNRGDFYPNWLRGFVTALMDPMPRLKDLRARKESIALGPQMSFSCIRRDDRPGGITDELTWSEVCFKGDKPALEFAMDFTYNMEFHNLTAFGKKEIARTYITGTQDHQRLVGTLTTLEKWNVDQNALAIANPTAPADRILTTFVSTATEESMVERAPTDVAWPTVREGKTEGYMIVHATTDKTGQVRETSKHNSDNPGLESFGREVALKYKFRPLLVEGAPHQMEMPLVLHFSTKLGDPIPELDDKATRKIITGCSLPHEIKNPASSGQKIVITFQVHEDGGLMTLGSSDRKIPVPVLYQQFRGCHFGQLKQNGKPTAYHANLTVTAQ